MSLLNIENIPGGMISGLSDEQLQFVTLESGERFLTELSVDFQVDLDRDRELPSLTEEQLSYLNSIEKIAIPKATSNQTKQHVKQFREFLKEKGLKESFEYSR